MRGSWLLLGLYVAAAVWHALPVSAQLTPEHILPAVVGIEAEAVPDARSAGTLGTTRQASGVVIDDAGLVLTIGFVVMEADRVTVLAYDGKRLPATVVAYHGESGFGLLRVEAGLDVEPLRLGDASKLSAKDPVLIRSEEHTSELQSLMRISYAVFCLQKQKQQLH